MSKIMLISPKDNNFYNFRSELILKLKDLGHTVILVCPYGKKIDYFTERGCQFIDLTMDRRGTSVLKDFALMRRYAHLIKMEKPDVVLTYTTKPSVYAGFVCGMQKIPYIVNNAGLMEASGFFSKFMNLLYKLGFRKASCIMFQNEQEKEVIEGILHHRIHSRRIPGSGVNLSQFALQEYPKNETPVVINYVARIVKLKGIDELMECAKRIHKTHAEVCFTLYGDYDDDSYREKVADLEKQGILKYGGILMDMKPAIQAAHAVIHPSYYEGMTNVVLEHSAVGRVCLGSDIPGVRDGIENNKTGFLFNVKDVDSMVQAVEKFLTLSNAEKAEMGRLAREKMEKEFDRNIVTNVYMEEIERILKP